MPPPIGMPPVLLSLDYAKQQPALPAAVGDLAHYADAGLRIGSSIPDGSQGVAAAELVFRDTILQAQVSLAAGAEDDLYGVFVRSPTAELYYAFAVSPAGQVFVASYDGEYLPLVSGPLDPDIPFGHGLGQPNRFQVVAVGPSLTFILNGTLVTAEIVDERYAEGYLGFFVHHALTSEKAELAADWIQVRGLFPAG
jgi:hypothetical protein